MASETVVMPELGESVVEGVIVEWLIKPGDHVNVDDPLCEVETDKANAEIPSPIEGYVAEILVAVDEVVEVGNPLVTLSTERPEGIAAPSPKAPEPSAAPISAPEEDELETVLRTTSVPAMPSVSKAIPPAKKSSSWMDRISAVGNSIGNGGSPLTRAPMMSPGPAQKAAPAAKKSDDRWLPFGHPEGARAYRYPQPRVEDGDTVEKFSRRRQIIAEHMIVSQAISPHVVTVAEVDMTNVVNLRAAHKGRLKSQGISLTYFAFMLKATCEALGEFPVMNSIVGDRQLIKKKSIHLGFAAETPAGLVVPVIRRADELNLVGLAKAISRLAVKARDNNLVPDDISGGTFTVSNPGRKGNLYGGAIINQPQVGILRMGEMKKRPMVITRDGQDVIAIRQMMYIALSYDHRVIDGVTGNSFLHRVRELLETADFNI